MDMDDDEIRDRLSDLEEQMESHPYDELSHKLEEIRIVIDTLEQNYTLLSDFVDEWLKNKEIALKIPLSQKMEIRRELYRRLHNYLASYHTQYEFTKHLRDKTLGVDNDNYNQLIKKHNIRPVSDFVKACRNYIQKTGPCLDAGENDSLR